jgi:hypothetical protein
MEQLNFRVEFDDFTKRHYIKKFRKAYKDKWPPTELAINDACERIDNMLLYSRADCISTFGTYQLVKLDFAIEGTQTSPKSSGNRCILLVDNSTRLVRVLLVYSKNDISEPNETQKWKDIIKNEYKDVSNKKTDLKFLLLIV